MLDEDQLERREWLELVLNDSDLRPSYSLAQQERLQLELVKLNELSSAKPLLEE